MPISYQLFLERAPVEALHDEPMTDAQIAAVNKYMDSLFSRLGIDPVVTKHFAERLQDDRNNPHINIKEMKKIIDSLYAKYGKELAKIRGPEVEAAVKSLSTDIVLPFAITWDERKKRLRFRFITVMRKKNFVVKDAKTYIVEQTTMNQPQNTSSPPDFPIMFEYPITVTKERIKQISSAFQPSLSESLKKVEHTINYFGYTLALDEQDYEELDTEDNGDATFVVYTNPGKDLCTNVLFTVEWEKLDTGIKSDLRADGAKLRYDVNVRLLRVDPEDVMSVIEDQDVSEITD